MSNPVTNNPNATTAGVSGIGGGALVVYLLGLAGLDLSPEMGAVIAGAIATAALFIGRRGVRGALSMLWRGSSQPN